MNSTISMLMSKPDSDKRLFRKDEPSRARTSTINEREYPVTVLKSEQNDTPNKLKFLTKILLGLEHWQAPSEDQIAKIRGYCMSLAGFYIEGVKSVIAQNDSDSDYESKVNTQFFRAPAEPDNIELSSKYEEASVKPIDERLYDNDEKYLLLGAKIMACLVTDHIKMSRLVENKQMIYALGTRIGDIPPIFYKDHFVNYDALTKSNPSFVALADGTLKELIEYKFSPESQKSGVNVDQISDNFEQPNTLLAQSHAELEEFFSDLNRQGYPVDIVYPVTDSVIKQLEESKLLEQIPSDKRDLLEIHIRRKAVRQHLEYLQLNDKLTLIPQNKSEELFTSKEKNLLDRIDTVIKLLITRTQINLNLTQGNPDDFKQDETISDEQLVADLSKISSSLIFSSAKLMVRLKIEKAVANGHALVEQEDLREFTQKALIEDSKFFIKILFRDMKIQSDPDGSEQIAQIALKRLAIDKSPKASQLSEALLDLILSTLKTERIEELRIDTQSPNNDLTEIIQRKRKYSKFLTHVLSPIQIVGEDTPSQN